MSSLLAHKSIRIKKSTHGTHTKDGSEPRPSDVLIDRSQQVKHITKSLIAYYEGLAAIQNTTAKATSALTETIQVPFHEGHQFLGTGGWQEALYSVRDHTKVLADHHSGFATTIQKTVVKELEGVRSELKAHISAIEKEAGALADEVDKERASSTAALTQLQTGIDAFENSDERMLPQHDPLISHKHTHTQLTKQIHKENDLQAALIRFQQQQEGFETGIFKSIQSACKLFDNANDTYREKILLVQIEISKELQKVPVDAEYKVFAAREGALIDPNSPTRSVDAITFPGIGHVSVTPIKAGILERKKRYTKSYSESHYILTPSGYLHESKSPEAATDLKPTFSLFLPECSLGPPSKETDKSHKFHIEGNKAVKSTLEGKFKKTMRFGGREFAYSLRARTHAEMLAWWTECDKLTRDTKTERNGATTTTVTPVAAAVANIGLSEPTTFPTEPVHSLKNGGIVPVTADDPVTNAGLPKSTETEGVSVKTVEEREREEAEAEEEEDDEEEGGSSAEEEEELARTAPSTPAATLGQATSPLDAEEAEGTAEVLPTYTGNGTTAAEKAGLHEKAAGGPAASTSA